MRSLHRAALLGALLASATVTAEATPLVSKQYSATAGDPFGAGSFTLEAAPDAASLGLANVTAFSWTIGSTTFGLGDLDTFSASSWFDDFGLEALTFSAIKPPSALGLVSFELNFTTLAGAIVTCKQAGDLGGNSTVADRRLCLGRQVPSTRTDFELQPIGDTSVPEPTTLALLGAGLLGLARQAQRRKS